MLNRITEVRTVSLKNWSNEELANLRTDLRLEMRSRGMANSVGVVGEQLAIEYFRKTPGLPKLQLAPSNAKNVDALSRDGDRYSIKARCLTSRAKKTGTVYQPHKDKGKQLFEFMLIVTLKDDWSLESIHQLTWADFIKVRSKDTRMGAWYVGISKRVFSTAKVVYQSKTQADA